jgi:hypothetical protein
MTVRVSGLCANPPTPRQHQKVATVPGGRGLFSVLQQVLKVRTENGTRLRVFAEVHTILEDFRLLATDLNDCLTHIVELIPSSFPATIGAQDAAGPGMGGVHLVPMPDGSILPMLWCLPFPPEVQRSLMYYANPTGNITSSDLELVASMAHHEILVTNVDAREATVHNFSDKTPTVYWQLVQCQPRGQQRASCACKLSTSGGTAMCRCMIIFQGRQLQPTMGFNGLTIVASFQFFVPPDSTLVSLPTFKVNALCADLGVVDTRIRSCVTSKRANAMDNHWGRWEQF